MKKINHIVSLLVAALVFSSCTDMLTEEHQTKVTTKFLFSDKDALERAVIALYSVDRSYFKVEDQVNPFTYMLDIGTDLTWFRGGGGRVFSAYTGMTTKNANVEDFWTHQYRIIGKSNEIIYAASIMAQTDSIVLRIKGEASLFRAQAYYRLWVKFGRIYLNTEPVTYQNLDSFVYVPATKEEVFSQIKNDLDTAIYHLNWTTPTMNGSLQYGRFNKGVAKHLKATVAMWEEDWQEAITQTEDIFASPNHYQLMTEPKTVFEGANLNHSETIFAYQFSNEIGGGGSLVNGIYMGHRLGTITVAQYRLKMKFCDYENGCYGWGRLMPNNYLFSLYDKTKDKRYQQYYRQYFLKIREDQTPLSKAVGDTVFPASSTEFWDNFHPQVAKFMDKWTALVPEQTNSFKDIILYRLAETYLMAAEAYMRIENQPKAREFYNKTWMRAGNDLETRDITLQMIMDEHARELGMEGHRFEFLKRIGKLYDQIRNYSGEYTTNIQAPGKNLGVNVLTSYYKTYAAPAASADARFYYKNEYENWPIPQSEIDQMGAENFPQNPGYN